jgi:hypothetical protein
LESNLHTRHARFAKRLSHLRAPLLVLAGVGVAFAAGCSSSASTKTNDSSPTPGATIAKPVGTLSNADGWPRVEGTRGKRYCEVLLASLVEGRLNAEVWNTYGLNDCPPDAWKALDPATIKTERGVLAALLNGPRYWLMDAIEKKPTGDRKETVFGTLTMFRAATVDLGPPPPNLSPYLEHRVARGAIFEYEKGAHVFELVDPTGKTYIMQSYSQQRDATLVESDLPALGTSGRITPPSGWTYRARTLDASVRVQGPGPEAAVIQDDLANSYSLIEPN